MDAESRRLVEHKIKTVDGLRGIIGPRPRDRKVIMCHGTFDVVHPGHIRHLLYAKGKADILIASLTSDEHIKKASFRPFVPQELRAINLAALEIVDYVIIDSKPTPLENISLLQPDYFAKGYEYASDGLHPRTAQEVAALEAYGGEVIFTPGDIVYSSSALLEESPPNIGLEKLLVLMEAEGIDFGVLHDALDAIRGTRVHVVGDTIVDSLTMCSMIGGVTKTPTISVRFEERRDYVGGAGVVAKHLKAAGAVVDFSTVLGDDELKQFVLDDLGEAGVNCRAVIDATRPTTNKNAIVAAGYRMLKVDTLDNRAISGRILARLTERVRSTSTDVLVYSDFRHGVFNRDTIPQFLEAVSGEVVRVADSQVASRWGNILEFTGFDLITPNEREARFALGDQDSVVRPLATELHRRAGCGTLILKLGSRGILTYRTRPKGDPRTVVAIDSFADRVVDPVGAGDALLAYAALGLKATGNDVVASILGNLAAGCECEEDGNEPIRPEMLREKLERLERAVRYLP